MTDRVRVISSRTATAAAVIVVIAALHLGRDLLIPFALAALITLMLAPVVAWVQRRGLGRVPAVLVVVTLVFGLLGWVGWLVAGQVSDLIGKLPNYRENIRVKTASLDGRYRRVTEKIIRILPEVRPVTAPAPGSAEDKSEPFKVEVVQTHQGMLEKVGGYAGSLLGYMGVAAVVLLLVLFLLIYHADVRDRMIHMMGVSQVTATTQAMNEAATNVSTYLLMQSIINVTYGAALAGGLFVIGIPNALLWGFLAALLRYIPYVGPWMAAAPPVLLSVAAFEGWARPGAVIGFIAVLELLSNNVMEPWLYGHRSGLSPLAVILAAVFWAWMWGGMGLMLAVPLTVCLVVLGRHVPSLRFLNTLLGRDAGLRTEAQFYHRLLARDPEDASELAEEYGKGKSFEAVCDSLFIPALAMAEQNRHFGVLEDDPAASLRQNLRLLMDELGDAEPAPAAAAQDVFVLCLAADDPADDLAAAMLAQVLSRNGFRAETLPESATTGEKAERAELLRPDIVCISALPPGALAPCRYLYKRLRQRLGDREIVVGLWNFGNDLEKMAGRIALDGKIRLVGTLAAALQQVQELAAPVRLLKKAETATAPAA